MTIDQRLTRLETKSDEKWDAHTKSTQDQKEHLDNHLHRIDLGQDKILKEILKLKEQKYSIAIIKRQLVGLWGLVSVMLFSIIREYFKK